MSKAKLSDFVADASQRYATARKIVRDEKQAAGEADDRVLDAQEAQRVLQLVAQTVQQQAHDRIATVVTRCLAAVFDDPYEFKILFEQKRGRTEARLVFMREGNEVDPLGGSAGGAVDVAAFALRLACMMLSQPPVRRLLVLDEPFKFVSACYRPRVRVLLEQLQKEMDVQFIFVTHIPELMVGTVVEL